MSDDWIPGEAAALADFVLKNVLTGIRPLMANPAWPAALTEDLIRQSLRPSIVTQFDGMIRGGSWSPKTGWKTAAAQKARGGTPVKPVGKPSTKPPVGKSGPDLTDEEVKILIWRILATEMPEADLSTSLGITRSQVLTAASTLPAGVRAQIGIA